MNLCKDCKHHLLPQGTELVAGEPIAAYTKCMSPDQTGFAAFCLSRRTNLDDKCGPEGKLWEPRP